MNEVEYERSQELQAIGEHVNACMAAIMDPIGAETLYDLQRSAFKYTAAGISISFQLDDGSYVWNGDKRAHDRELVGRVKAIGFSSIVEGSDAEVPLQWMDLTEMETPEAAVAEYDRLTEITNDEACALWEEANSGEE